MSKPEMKKEATPDFVVYSGTGQTAGDRGVTVPKYDKKKRLNHPSGYLAEPGVKDAVNVAIALGQPLLLTGEPGTGKTQLARSVAYELGIEEGPLVSHVKTSATARDLFYRYDALGHFHASQFSESPPAAEDFIDYEALGLAILLAGDPDENRAFIPDRYHGKGARRSVVLLDEVDKAPRDLPNDVLNEIEHMEFTVKETGNTFRADPGNQPIVILTSNSERNLPDAFLRRCVFYHLTFPDRTRLKAIVRSRLGDDAVLSDEAVEAAITRFYEIRKLPDIKKKPATAELLGWIRLLDRLHIDLSSSSVDRGAVKTTLGTLAKNKEDLTLIEKRIAE